MTRNHRFRSRHFGSEPPLRAGTGAAMGQSPQKSLRDDAIAWFGRPGQQEASVAGYEAGDDGPHITSARPPTAAASTPDAAAGPPKVAGSPPAVAASPPQVAAPHAAVAVAPPQVQSAPVLVVDPPATPGRGSGEGPMTVRVDNKYQVVSKVK